MRSPFKPNFQTQAMPQQVCENLRQVILEGNTFRAGERINIDQLSQDWNVSKTPIREALKVLEQAQLINYIPRRGFFVVSLGMEELLDLADLRMALEIHALDRAFATIDHRKMKMLRSDFLKASKILKESGDVTAYLEADEAFHTFIIHSAHNTKIADIYTTMRGSMKYLRYCDTFKTGAHMGATLPEHLAIIEAILHKDREEALKCLRQHLLNVQKRLVENIPG